ncbi:MAG: SpoIID/LytB domain-containing protein, partial [Candidatus Coprovivens sp.]
MPKNNVIDYDYNFVDIDYNDQQFKITLQDYIIGVVAAEMPASFHEEALKAQSIASRTYLINTMSTTPIDTTTNNQVYIDKQTMKEKWGTDFETYYNKISKCVKDTKREIITYNNQPIKAFYHSMS